MQLQVQGKQEDQIRFIATRENRDADSVVLDLIDRSIQQYLASNSAPSRSAHCQLCGHLTPRRKLHAIVVGYDVFIFCDPDFFSGAYKSRILQLLP